MRVVDSLHRPQQRWYVVESESWTAIGRYYCQYRRVVRTRVIAVVAMVVVDSV
jgi:hypothetical protein